MLETSQLKIALIGLGDIAQKAYLPIVCCHENVLPVLCTRNQTTLDRLQRKYRVTEAYNSIDDLIESGIDAAMVHSSTESHYAIVKKMLEARIPAFVDKPLSYSLEETEELVKLSSENKTLLYLGFNRRFAPLINRLSNEQGVSKIEWNKHRKNLPSEPRTFILDDFIHVIDSLRFLAPGKMEDFNLDFKMNNKLLEAISVSWKVNNIEVYGAMNRMHHTTEEFVHVSSQEKNWTIFELMHGTLNSKEQTMELGFDNWDSTLYKRGFVDLFEDFLSAIQAPNFNLLRNQATLDTHSICEHILTQISKHS